jgi:hypothetical protein
MNADISAQAVGEVLTSSITSVTAECWSHDNNEKLGARPRFGSFLKIDSTDTNLQIFAVVFNVMTGPPDTVHKPWALGLTRSQLRIEQPQIFSLLRTEIHAQIVGYRESYASKNIRHYLPPHSPDVHDFIYPASQAEVRELTTNFEFLRLLLDVSAVPTDELLAATIREAQKVHDNHYAYLLAAGQALSQLLHNDYDRLVSLLKKIRPGA